MTEETESEERLREIPASEILDKIQKGEPVEYDHVRIVGDLEQSKLDLPIERTNFHEEARLIQSRIKITNSRIDGETLFISANFLEPVELSGTTFSGEILTFKKAIYLNPSSQEDACRRAKIVLESAGDREEAGYYFYREMEGKRRQKDWYVRYPEFIFIQLIFGYGVHPFRLWAFWLGFVGVFALIYSDDALQARLTLMDHVLANQLRSLGQQARLRQPGFVIFRPVEVIGKGKAGEVLIP